MKRTFLRLAVGLTVGIIVTQGVVAQSSASSPIPTDSEIRKILIDRIEKEKQSVGIVVGVIEPTGRRIIAYGNLAKNDKRLVDGDTVFEIGSITKVFTSLLLADMVQRGEVALSDPVAKYLPANVKMPERGGRQITLQDLATHTSGLPRLPSNLKPRDPSNPYADYSIEQLYQFLSTYQLTRDIGTQYEYSNLGGGLLGHVLSLRAGVDYATLVRSRICEPLGMGNTRIMLSPEMKLRFATGYNATLEPVGAWDLTTLAGAGALRSTANDLLTFLAANLGYTKSPLAPAMAAMPLVRRPTGTPGLEIALGWHILMRGGREIVWHNGGTGGFRSFIAYDPKARVGVVVLSNAQTPAGIDDIGQHLLNTSVPLYQPPKERKQITVNPTLFDGYTGRYQLAPNFILNVTREGDHLFTQATGQSKVEIFPESERDYFLKVVDAQITFETDGQGRANSLVLHQNGMNQHAKRIDGEPALPKEHKQVALDSKLLDGYTGRYQLGPNFILSVTREGDRLFTQATGQEKFEVFPESDHDFFCKAFDAQITFVTDSQGRTTELILHQNGLNPHAKRME